MKTTGAEVTLQRDLLDTVRPVFATLPLAVMITDGVGTIVEVNPAFTRITGYTHDDVLGKTPRVLSSGRHDRAFYEAFWRTLATQGQWQGEIWNRRKNGEIYPEWLSVSVLPGGDGRATHFIAIFSDITAVKLADQRTLRLAYYDALTGLPNRSVLLDRMSHALTRARRSNQRVGILFIDIDGFKHVNDCLGHATGDAALLELSTAMVACIRESDTLARIGGDEFVVLAEGLTTDDEVTVLAEKLLAAVARPLDATGRRLRVTASIGIAVSPEDGGTADALLERADSAMYHAKRAGKNRIAR